MDSHSTELASSSPYSDLYQALEEAGQPSWWIDSLKAVEDAIVLGTSVDRLADTIIEKMKGADLDKTRMIRVIESPDFIDYVQQLGGQKSYGEAVVQEVRRKLGVGSSSGSGSSGSSSGGPSSGGSSSSGTGSKVTGPGTARRTQNASLLGGTGPKIVGAVALAGAAAYAGRDWLREKLS